MGSEDAWQARANTAVRFASRFGSRLPLGWRLAVRAAPFLLPFVLRLGKVVLSSTPARVHGRSMEPTLFDGDFVAVRVPDDGEPHVGQIVVARAGGREVVKRVAAIEPEGIRLRGDNRKHSTDPDLVPREAIRGVVIVRYWPPLRAF